MWSKIKAFFAGITGFLLGNATARATNEQAGYAEAIKNIGESSEKLKEAAATLEAEADELVYVEIPSPHRQTGNLNYDLLKYDNAMVYLHDLYDELDIEDLKVPFERKIAWYLTLPPALWDKESWYEDELHARFRDPANYVYFMDTKDPNFNLRTPYAPCDVDQYGEDMMDYIREDENYTFHIYPVVITSSDIEETYGFLYQGISRETLMTRIRAILKHFEQEHFLIKIPPAKMFAPAHYGLNIPKEYIAVLLDYFRSQPKEVREASLHHELKDLINHVNKTALPINKILGSSEYFQFMHATHWIYEYLYPESLPDPIKL